MEAGFGVPAHETNKNAAAKVVMKIGNLIVDEIM